MGIGIHFRHHQLGMGIGIIEKESFESLVCRLLTSSASESSSGSLDKDILFGFRRERGGLLKCLEGVNICWGSSKEFVGGVLKYEYLCVLNGAILWFSCDWKYEICGS